jgi:hypothetical protein
MGVAGPIVRITPYEVHVNDPAFFNELYNVTKKVDKDPWYYSWLDRNGSIFSTTDADLHKLRSAVIKKSFSSVSIAKVEPVLKQHMETYCRRLNECRESKTEVPLGEVYRSLAVDIVTDLSLPESFCLLDKPDFGAAHAAFIRDITEFALWNRHFVYLNQLLERLPRWVVGLQGPAALNVVDALNDQKQQALNVVVNDGKPISSKNYPVVMNEVYKFKGLPPSEKTPKRLYEEIAILIGAGSETAGHTLSTITYHVLANPDIYQALKEETRTSFTAEESGDVLSYKRLESLPYLNACIYEGLRLGTAVSGRLPRVNKSQPTHYNSPSGQVYTIPPDYPISMSLRDIHYSPANYPDPTVFKPERWLGAQRTMSEKGFAAFGRGARSCVGRLLAMAELQMAIGNLFGRFDIKLAAGTGRDEVEIEHDCFSPYPKRDNNGMLVELVG